MSYRKLRDFLNKLEQLGELIRIQEPLSPQLEIPAVAAIQHRSLPRGSRFRLDPRISRVSDG
jgi:UbiD family decarboxylase